MTKHLLDQNGGEKKRILFKIRGKMKEKINPKCGFGFWISKAWIWIEFPKKIQIQEKIQDHPHPESAPDER